MLSVEIVEAQPRHAHAISAFMRGFVAENLTTVLERDVAPTPAEELEFIKRVALDARAVIILAVSLGTVVGMLDFHGHPKPQMAHGGEFGVSVAQDYRRQGIAKRLIERLFGWTADRQFKRVELRVLSHNMPAIKLYSFLGFVQEGRQKNAVRVGDGFVDMLYMTRFL